MLTHLFCTVSADPNCSDVCKAIIALYNLRRQTPAFTFALKYVNDAKRQDFNKWSSFTLAGVAIVGGAALFATLTPLLAAAAGGGAAAGSALVPQAAAGGALVVSATGSAVPTAAAATAAAATTTAVSAGGATGFAVRALFGTSTIGTGVMTLRSHIELAQTKEG